jgi:hypothetical protein
MVAKGTWGERCPRVDGGQGWTVAKEGQCSMGDKVDSGQGWKVATSGWVLTVAMGRRGQTVSKSGRWPRKDEGGWWQKCRWGQMVAMGGQWPKEDGFGRVCTVAKGRQDRRCPKVDGGQERTRVDGGISVGGGGRWPKVDGFGWWPKVHWVDGVQG